MVVAVAQDWLDWWAAFLSDLPTTLALVVFLLPIVLAIFSRKIALGLGCLIMVVAAGLVFIAPAKTPVIFATALYIGSVIASLAAIIARRRKSGEFQVLQMQVRDLMAAEQRRLMREMRSRSKGQGTEGPVG
jgi:hypothetical protein